MIPEGGRPSGLSPVCNSCRHPDFPNLWKNRANRLGFPPQPPHADSKFSREVRGFCCRVVCRCQLLDLPWEDVLVPHVLCYLPLQHLVRLQRVSKQFHSLIQVYLANCKTFDPSSVSQRYIMQLCNIIAIMHKLN